MIYDDSRKETFLKCLKSPISETAGRRALKTKFSPPPAPRMCVWRKKSDRSKCERDRTEGERDRTECERDRTECERKEISPQFPLSRTVQNANGTAQNANGTAQNANGTVQNANGKQLLSRFSGGWGVRSNFPPKLVTRGGSIYHLRQGCISSVEFL